MLILQMHMHNLKPYSLINRDHLFFYIFEIQLDVGSTERLDERKHGMPLKNVIHLNFSYRGWLRRVILKFE